MSGAVHIAVLSAVLENGDAYALVVERRYREHAQDGRRGDSGARGVAGCADGQLMSPEIRKLLELARPVFARLAGRGAPVGQVARVEKGRGAVRSVAGKVMVPILSAVTYPLRLISD